MQYLHNEAKFSKSPHQSGKKVYGDDLDKKNHHQKINCKGSLRTAKSYIFKRFSDIFAGRFTAETTKTVYTSEYIFSFVGTGEQTNMTNWNNFY